MARRKPARKAGRKAKAKKAARKPARRARRPAARVGPAQNLGPSIDAVRDVIGTLNRVKSTPGAEMLQFELDSAIGSLSTAASELDASCRRARKIPGS